MDELITHAANFDDNFLITGVEKQQHEYKIELQTVFLSPNYYSIDIALVSGNEHFDMIENTLLFSMIAGNKIKRGPYPSHAKIFLNSKWQKI